MSAKTESVLIRQFAENDTEALIALWQDCGLTRPWNDPRKDIQRKLQVQPELFLVAEEYGDLAGSAMAGYDGHRGSVYYLAVHPNHRRRGLGRLLMAQVETRLASYGCPKLNVMVRHSNLDVTNFYQCLGYEDSDVHVLGKRLIEDQAD